MKFGLHLSAILLLAFVLPGKATPGLPVQNVAVEIEVQADSSNYLHAHVIVTAGTPARDLMESLFTVTYLDAARKFVVGIAGFQAPARERKFWRLEVEGRASEVGIAEIMITRGMHLRWMLVSY